MWLLLAFLAVPLIEIALFVQVGGAIGLGPTLAIVILTALAGTMLVRSQGSHALMRLRSAFDRREDPSAALADGAMILFAGALLLTPGFFTDALGFALLIPQCRAAIRRFVASRIEVQRHTEYHREMRSAGGTVIEGEYEDVTPRGRTGPSGWTQS